MEAEIPSPMRADCGVCGQFTSVWSHKLAIVAMQWQAQVMPPCHCVANALSLWYEDLEIIATGGRFWLDHV